MCNCERLCKPRLCKPRLCKPRLCKIVQTKIAVAAQLCLLPAHIAVSCRRRFRHFADCQRPAGLKPCFRVSTCPLSDGRMATRIDWLLPSLELRHLPLFQATLVLFFSQVIGLDPILLARSKIAVACKCHFTENLAKLHPSIISAPLNIWSRTEQGRADFFQKAHKLTVLPKAPENP